MYFRYANFEHIVLVVKKYANLREIVVVSFDNATILKDDFGFGGEAFDEEPKFINLSRLNKERAKLPDAKKITLFVTEHQY